MENKKHEATAAKKPESNLKALDIHQLEERLEVSSLVPGAQGQGANTAFIDIDVDNCCNEKCNGEIHLDDPIDTGEINGGNR